MFYPCIKDPCSAAPKQMLECFRNYYKIVFVNPLSTASAHTTCLVPFLSPLHRQTARLLQLLQRAMVKDWFDLDFQTRLDDYDYESHFQ